MQAAFSVELSCPIGNGSVPTGNWERLAMWTWTHMDCQPFHDLSRDLIEISDVVQELQGD